MSRFLCPFPWIFPCVTTSGTFRVCPVSQSSLSKGTVENKDGTQPHIETVKSPLDVLNADSLVDLRRRILQGEDVSDTCRRCITEEKHGLQSRRRIELKHHPEFNEELVKKWTLPDGRLAEGSPITLLILRMGNKCNLVCRMCGPSSSSAWYDEWAETKRPGFQEEMGRISLVKDERGRAQPSPNPYEWVENDSAMKFVEMCGPSLKTLHFSGGEPLLVKGHLEILRYLVKTQRSKDISLEYNSNLTVLTDEVLELWSQFKYLEIGISVDGPPDINEYIRHPVKTERLLNNIRRLDESKANVCFWLSVTVQIYNVFYLDELEKWMHAQNFKRMHRISWHVLRGPKELSIYALPEPVKHQVVESLEKSPSFKKVSEIIFEEDYTEHFGKFVTSTKQMDLYRKQSIEKLDQLWKHIALSFQ